MLGVLLPLFVLLGPPAARAAPPPELLCEPDAKVSFEARWLRGSSVRFVGDATWELPWTGKEPVVPGSALKLEDATALAELSDDAAFLAFRPAQEGSPRSALFIQRELVTGSDDDGLVVTAQHEGGSAGASAPELRVYHCRRR